MKFYLLLVFVITVPTQAVGQNWMADGASTVGSDIAHILTSPARVNRHNASRVIGILGLGAGIIFSADAPFGEAAPVQSPGEDLDPRRELPEPLTGAGVAYDRVGTTWITLSGASLLAATGLATGNERLIVTAGRALEAVIITKTLTSISKRVVGRARPFNGTGPRDFQFLDFGNPREYRSLPSGHSSSAFALATVLANRHGQWWVRYGAYAMATSVALQRVDSRSHWISDTLFGGALGYAIGKAILRNEKKTSGLTFQTGATRQVISGGLQYAF